MLLPDNQLDASLSKMKLRELDSLKLILNLLVFGHVPLQKQGRLATYPQLASMCIC